MASNLDYFLVGGVFITLLACWSFLNAFSSDQTPRAAAVLAIMGLSMVAYPVSQKPQLYSVEQFPEVLGRVISSVTR